MNEQLREKDTSVHSDNGGRWVGRSRTEADVGLGANVHAEAEAEDEYTPVHVIPETLLTSALLRIEKANRRLERAGIEERFTYDTEASTYQTKDGREIATVKLTLSRPRIGFNGWVFTGAHDFTDDGATISYRREPGPDVNDAHCDFCGKTRHRSRVYTVHSETEGDKQIGQSCLKLFFGIKPEGLWSLDVDLQLEGDDYDADDLDRYFGSRGEEVYPAEEMLAVASAVSAQGTEFVPKSRESKDNPSTAWKVTSGYTAALSAVTDDDRQLATDTLEWLRSTDDNSDYGRNLKAALLPTGDEPKAVRSRHVGIAASAISAYLRAKSYAEEKRVREELAKKQRAEFQPGFVAPVGERFKQKKATVLRTKVIEVDGYSFHSDRDYKTIVTMITEDGHQTTWFASGAKSFAAGQTVVMDATVKNHEQYDGADQTVVTRATLRDPETGEKLN